MSASFAEEFARKKNLSYLERINEHADDYLLLCINMRKFSDFIMLGMDSRIPETDESLSIGNIVFIIEAIYRNYIKHPENKINAILKILQLKC